ncbi:MAG: phage shock protein E [Alteromonadaceae bacterium]|jgi:phage shock protein E
MLKTIPDIVKKIRKTVNTITATNAYQQCLNDKGIIIDVREPSEVSQKSAQGTVNIPRGLLEMKMLELYPDENQMIYLHCATGARATFSAEQLQRIGYENVWVITCQLDEICSIKP